MILLAMTRRILLSLTVLAGSATAQNLWVVDASGAGSFTSLGAAVAAASGGDILLIRSSDPAATGSVQVNGKGLTLVGDGPGVTIAHTLWPQHTPGNTFLSVRNLSLVGSASGGCLGLLTYNARGVVFMEDVALVALPGCPAIRWNNPNGSAVGHIVLVDCTVIGGDALPGQDGQPGAEFGVGIANARNVSAYGTSFQGGHASPGNGGPGLFLRSTQVLLSGSDASGGNSQAGTGGAGCVVDQVLQFNHQASVFTAGSPAVGPGLVGASPVGFDEPNRTFKVAQAVLVEGETGTLSYSGAVGDVVLGMVSLAPASLFQFAEGGVIHVSFPLVTTIFFGSMATGSFSLPFGVPELGPGVDGLPVYVQALVQDDDGLKLSAPSMTLLLDSSL